MATETNPIAQQFSGFSSLSVGRQISLLIVIAGMVAVGTGVYLWMSQPVFQSVYAGLGDREMARVVEQLVQNNVPYRIEQRTGAVQVPVDQVASVRMQVAAEGFVPGASRGFEMMADQGFGTSQFLERARYFKAQEGELERSITAMAGIASARVHLAIPKPSVFVRRSAQPSASVMVTMLPGRMLDQERADALIYLVASSVPDLQPRAVTVVDQNGRMLSGRQRSPMMEMTDSQLAYTSKLEDALSQRIESIITPITGLGGVRAQISAEVDFSRRQNTQESYDPARIVRSEQHEGGGAMGRVASGIAGALSNQPLGETRVPEQGAPASSGGRVESTGQQTAMGGDGRSVVNYELGRTISHFDQAAGALERLSIAVVVDYRRPPGSREQGEALTSEELERIERLVRQAVGFDEIRGDSMAVTNVPFVQPEAIEALPEPALWQQGWVLNLAKQAAGGLLILLLVFGLLRPMSRNLVTRAGEVMKAAPVPALEGAEAGTAVGQLPAAGGAQTITASFESEAEAAKAQIARQIASEDPKKVSQVVKGWIAAGED